MEKRILLKNLHLTDINPMVCGAKSFEYNDFFPLHHIKRHVLHYVTKGSGRFLCNGQELPVREGDIFVCHPGYYTSYIPDAEDPFAYIWVSFECTPAFAALLNRDVFPAPWSRHIFEQMLAVSEAAAPEWAICARLYDFFAALAQRQPATTPPPNDYVNRAINFIQANYPDSIQIADIAADLGLSRNYFCRIFRQQMGLSPQEYLISYRLTMAAGLLMEQNLSQKEVALQVGYPDVCAFSRMFKRKYGMSPGQYVAQEKSNNAQQSGCRI